MTISQTITVYPGAAPDSDTMTPAEFDAAANTFAAHIEAMPGELNTWATQANGMVSAIEAAESDAIAAVEAARIDPIIYGDEVYQFFAAEDLTVIEIETWWETGQNPDKFVAMQQNNDALEQFLASSIAVTNAEKSTLTKNSMHGNTETMAKWLCHVTAGLSVSSHNTLSSLLGTAIDFGLVANSATGMDVLLNKTGDDTLWDAAIGNATSRLELLKSQIAMDLVYADATKRSEIISTSAIRTAAVGSQDAMAVMADSADWMGQIVASIDWMNAVYGSVNAKRAMFASQTAEVAIRESQTAVDAAINASSIATDDIAGNVYGSPSPLNTTGKWFVVAVTDVGDLSAGYTKGGRSFKNGSDFQTDLSFNSYTHPPPFNSVLSPTGVTLAVAGCPFSGRFYTKVEIMVNANISSNYTMTLHYIDMDN